MKKIVWFYIWKFILVVLFCSVIFSLYLFLHIFLGYVNKDSAIQITNETTITADNLQDLDCKNKMLLKKSEHKTEKNFVYTVLYISFFVISGFVITIIFVLILKDDTGLRYAKLDELHSIKKKLLYCPNNKKSDSETNIDDNQLEFFNMDTSTVYGAKEKIITKTSNRAALLKHYMTCVTEI